MGKMSLRRLLLCFKPERKKLSRKARNREPKAFSTKTFCCTTALRSPGWRGGSPAPVAVAEHLYASIVPQRKLIKLMEKESSEMEERRKAEEALAMIQNKLQLVIDRLLEKCNHKAQDEQQQLQQQESKVSPLAVKRLVLLKTAPKSWENRVERAINRLQRISSISKRAF